MVNKYSFKGHFSISIGHYVFIENQDYFFKITNLLRTKDVVFMAEKILSVQNFQFRLQRFLDSFFSVQFHIILIILGVILRLKVYFKNNSFWLDEAWVALDISTRTFSDIFSAKILSSDLPTPPPVFSLIEKLFITLFFNN